MIAGPLETLDAPEKALRCENVLYRAHKRANFQLPVSCSTRPRAPSLSSPSTALPAAASRFLLAARCSLPVLSSNVYVLPCKTYGPAQAIKAGMKASTYSVVEMGLSFWAGLSSAEWQAKGSTGAPSKAKSRATWAAPRDAGGTKGLLRGASGRPAKTDVEQFGERTAGSRRSCPEKVGRTEQGSKRHIQQSAAALPANTCAA